MFQIKKEREAMGDECWAMWGRGRAAQNEHEFNFGSRIGFYLDVLRTRIDGRAGFHSKAATKRLLSKLDEINPDTVHLHNLHGYYVNIEMLFEWLASHGCEVVWTLHDCWAFTGHCAHFTYAKCAQWKSHCARSRQCPQLNAYPKTISKSSCAKNFNDKKRLFTSVPTNRMTLVTPSKWLGNLVKESFLHGYPIEVRRNMVDVSTFKPTPSDFRERYRIGDRFVILGVASPWTERKGLGVFGELCKKLDLDAYRIVLVGLDKKQLKEIDDEVIGIEKTDSKKELAQIYTAADVLLNPSIEETFGMVVVEAELCGTPALVMKGTACEEIMNPSISLSCNSDICAIVDSIEKMAAHRNG